MSEANTINDFYRGYLQGFKDSYHWVGLTDREMKDAIHIDDTPMEMGRKIEAKLKEKNTRNGGCL